MELMLEMKPVCDLCGMKGKDHETELWYSVTNGFAVRAGFFVEETDPKVSELILCEQCVGRLILLYKGTKRRDVRLKDVLTTLCEMDESGQFDDDVTVF